jgi:hypothetical protein
MTAEAQGDPVMRRRRVSLPERLESRRLLATFGTDDLGWAAGLVADGGHLVVRDVAADSSGNVYAVGEFSGAADFDAGPGLHVVAAPPGESGFVAAYTVTGAFRWVSTFGRSMPDGQAFVRPMGVAVAASGRVIVAGSYDAGGGTVDFDPGRTLAGDQALASAGDDGFVLKLTSDNRLLWVARLAGAESRDRVFDVAVDAAGGICVVGSASGKLDANPAADAEMPILNSGGTDGFAIKLSAAGVYEWSASVAGRGADAAFAVAAARDGSFVVGGSFERQADIDAAGRQLVSAGGSDGYLVRISAAGVTTWGSRIGGVGDDAVRGLADGGLLENGSVDQRFVVVGSIGGDASYARAGAAPVAAAFQAAGGIDSFVAAVANDGNLLWSRTLESPANDAALGVATDSTGGIVVIGRAEGVILPNDILNGAAADDPNAGIDGFAVGLKSDGAVRWKRHWGGFGAGRLGGAASVVEEPIVTSQDACLGVACRADGGVLVGGAFLEKSRIPAGKGWSSLTGAADPALNGFVSRIAVPVDADTVRAPAGLSSRVEGLIGDVVVRDAVVNPQTGEEFILGTFRGTVDFDTWPRVESLTSADPSVDEVFVLKRDGLSALKWVRRFTGAGRASAARLAMSPAGGVWVAGTFSGSIDFDPGDGVAPLVSAEGSADAYVAKLGMDGAFRWAKRVGGVGIDSASDVVADPVGGCIVVGSFTGVADVDPEPHRVDPRASRGETDAFVVKMSAAATWSRTFGGGGKDTAAAVALANGGGIFVAGGFTRTVDFDPGPGDATMTVDDSVSRDNPDVYVLKFTGEGDFRRVSVLRGPGIDSAGDIALDENVNVVVTGSFSRSLDVDPGDRARLFSAAGTTDAFVVKLSAGGLVWARQIAAQVGGTAFGTGVACGTGGMVYAVGGFSVAIASDPQAADQKTLVSRGKDDGYLVVIRADGTSTAGGAIGIGGREGDVVNGVAVAGVSPRVWGAFQTIGEFGRRSRPLQLVSPRSPAGGGGSGGFFATYDRTMVD